MIATSYREARGFPCWNSWRTQRDHSFPIVITKLVKFSCWRCFIMNRWKFGFNSLLLMSVFKAASNPLASVEKRSAWQSPGMAWRWPQIGAAQSSRQPQDQGQTKVRQMLYTTTGQSTYTSSPGWNASNASLAVFLLFPPAGHSHGWHKSQLADTTCLSCWHAKVVLWR